MKNRSLSEADIQTISAKIYAMGELLKFRSGEPAVDEEKVSYGIGEILTDLSAEIEHALAGSKPSRS